MPASGRPRGQLKKVTTPAGKYKFAVKGKNGNYPIDTAHLPLVGTLVIDVPFATTGQCGEAAFPGPTPPTCTLLSSGRTVKCK